MTVQRMRFGAECARQRPARSDGFETTAVAARAGRVGSTRNSNVPDITGRSLCSTLQHPAGDDTGTDTRGNFDEDHLGDIGPRRDLLAERHDVDVIVDEHRCIEFRLNGRRDIESMPPGHDGRADGAPRRELDRPRYPDAYPRNAFAR